MKRIFLFLATNLAVIAAADHRHPAVRPRSIISTPAWPQLRSLLVFVGGPRLRWRVHFARDVQVDGQDGHGRAGHRRSPPTKPSAGCSRRCAATPKPRGIGMPEVGVFDSPEPNAFATGARKNAALVAVSTGLLRNDAPRRSRGRAGPRNRARRQWRHGHAHADPGRPEYLRLLPRARHRQPRRRRYCAGTSESRGPGIGYFATVIVAQLVLGLLASMIVAWFSRQREFRADAGGAYLAGTRSMIGALEALKRAHSPKPLARAVRGLRHQWRNRRRACRSCS